MIAQLRMRADLMRELQEGFDLSHAFATERVAFAFGRSDGKRLVLLSSFLPVADDHYEPDHRVSARIGARAISAALQVALREQVATFHVHRHDHSGTPAFSRTDLRELPDVMLPFRHVVAAQPHGLLLLSHDALHCRVWWPGEPEPNEIREFNIVGSPMRLLRGDFP